MPLPQSGKSTPRIARRSIPTQSPPPDLGYKRPSGVVVGQHRRGCRCAKAPESQEHPPDRPAVDPYPVSASDLGYKRSSGVVVGQHRRGCRGAKTVERHSCLSPAFQAGDPAQHRALRRARKEGVYSEDIRALKGAAKTRTSLRDCKPLFPPFLAIFFLLNGIVAKG